ncbi:MAG: hypothetical protein NTW21_17180 [Verrucomicrobia bacterium]|nr:hypothetical protein [Verrucomicrobiota bacterium]
MSPPSLVRKLSGNPPLNLAAWYGTPEILAALMAERSLLPGK